MLNLASSLPVMALGFPSVELLGIIAFGTILPVGFFLWLKSWLDSVQDENPDHVIAEQSKADQAHLAHSGGHGHGHGEGHGKDHGHAHA